MINEILEKLKSSDTHLEYRDGLSEETLAKIEETYGIRLPKSLRELLKVFVPVKDQFTVYTRFDDFSDSNIALVKSNNGPLENLISLVKSGRFWCKKWGEMPETREEAETFIMKKTKDAPALLCIARDNFENIGLYLPLIDGEDDPPILSIGRGGCYMAYSSLNFYFSWGFFTYTPEEAEKVLAKFERELPPIPFWDDLITVYGDPPLFPIPRHENGIFYPANDFRSIGYMMNSLNGFHDYLLLDCEYKSGIRVRSRNTENGVSHEYFPITLLLRFYGANLYSASIAELVFTGISEWNIRGNLQKFLFGADVKLETHPHFGKGIRFRTSDDDTVFAKELGWRTLSSEFYFNGAIPLERSTENEREIIKKWVEVFGLDRGELNARLDFAEKYDADPLLWDLINSSDWLAGDEARAAFDAVAYDRALIFKTAYFSHRDEKIRMDEPCLIGKVSHTEFENLSHIDDIYIVAEDFSWTYIHTHESDFGPFFRRA